MNPPRTTNPPTLVATASSFLIGLALLTAFGACSGDETAPGGAAGTTAGSAGSGATTAGGTAGGGAGLGGGAGSGGSGTSGSAASGASGGGGLGGAPTGGVSFGGSGAGTSGGPATAGTAGAAGGVSEYANFATVREIVQLKCGTASCHLGEAEPTLADANLYATLTTYVSTMCENRVLVKPGAPEQSAFWLVQKGPCGTAPRMPNGCVDDCIPPEYIEGVRQWIANGAPQN